MKTLPSILIAVGLLNLGAVGFLALKLSKIETQVAAVSSLAALLRSSAPLPARPPSVSQKPANTAVDVPDQFASLNMKKAADIIPHINQTVPGKGIEGLARTLAEMDEWVFRPEDEGVASAELEAVADVLRDKIAARITPLSTSAVEAPNGKTAVEKMDEINSLLRLYPAPKTSEHRTKLEQITSGILSTARRVEDIRRLRYNGWAITRIETALSGYHQNKKTVGTDKDALTKSCIASLKIIDPAFLEPATRDLYNYVYGLTRDAASDDEFRVKLANGLSDPSTTRKTPVDF